MKRFFRSLILACLTLTLPALARAQMPKPGGTLVFGLERQLSTFNPFIRAGGVDLDVRTLIYEGLLDKDTKGNIVPALAETWTVSKDGLVYNFKLRRGVKFHNGKELTSADVKWKVKVLLLEGAAFRERQRSQLSALSESRNSGQVGRGSNPPLSDCRVD